MNKKGLAWEFYLVIGFVLIIIIAVGFQVVKETNEEKSKCKYLNGEILIEENSKETRCKMPNNLTIWLSRVNEFNIDRVKQLGEIKNG
jgi:hypothetical protein